MIKKSIILLALIGFAAIVCITGCDRIGGININGEKQTTRDAARQFAEDIGEIMDNYIGTLQSLSNEMSFYEDRTPEARRREFENMTQSVFEETPNFFQLFTVF